MAKTLITILIVLLFQNSIAQRADFGIKAGLNLSTLRTESNIYSYNAGMNLGVLCHLHIFTHFAIQPELLFSMQGAERKNTIYKNNLKLNYVNLPILAIYMFENGFRIETGPQPGFLVSAKNNFGGTETDIKNDIQGADLSWAFGAGYISKRRIGGDIRYNLGLSRVNKNGNNTDLKNGVFQFDIFYQFKGR